MDPVSIEIVRTQAGWRVGRPGEPGREFEQRDLAATHALGLVQAALAADQDVSLTARADDERGAKPVALAPARAPYPVEALRNREGPSKVLVVDDNPVCRQIMGLMLEAFGIEVVIAENGQDALEQWRRWRFDAILMDIEMPVLDGLATTRLIRAEETASRRTPIIIVSANFMPQHIEEGSQAGADLHLAKPITAASLGDALLKVAHAAPPRVRRLAVGA
jgi:CheY-like chemotaxis protein